MDLLEGIVLGAVQGITEFLPISSSGHLVLAQALLNVDSPGIFLEIATHAATVLAVLAYYRRKILVLIANLGALPRLSSASEEERAGLALIGMLLIASVPAGLVGLLLQDAIEKAFESPVLVLAMLTVTGVFLLATRLAPFGDSPRTLPRALAVGVAQAAAILPGISRSGSTIGTGLFTGADPEKAAEFSFLLSVPAIVGATLLHVLKVKEAPPMVPMAAAFVTAFFTGLIAIALLIRVLKKRSMWIFGIYCLVLGIVGMCWVLATG
ncbi:MAG: undecaprenyl-diphosphate phosphatase [Planctomycetota bacterium]|jgi:undecaprenyl-diphosphatase